MQQYVQQYVQQYEKDAGSINYDLLTVQFYLK